LVIKLQYETYTLCEIVVEPIAGITAAYLRIILIYCYLNWPI